jgi:hypothetical protein
MKTALFVAWRNQTEDNSGWGPVGRLEYESGVYRFFYTKGAKTLRGFRPFPEMPNIEEVYESDTLFPLFENRLLGSNRPEYERFLQWGGFSPAEPPAPVLILGVTEGKKVTDSVEVFPCPVPDAQGCLLSRFFVHGIRWLPKLGLERIKVLKSDERLYLMPDIQNPFDRHAVAIRTDIDRALIGYVPRYLAHDVYELFRKCDLDFIQMNVAQVNHDAPLQQRLLVQMRACWPEGFTPCSTEAFQPIAASVSSACS